MGLNYTSHATEVGLPVPRFPITCMKPPGALLYSPGSLEAGAAPDCGEVGSTVRVPTGVQGETDYEGELAFVVGARCRDVPNDAAAADAVIAGYTVALDITARKWQGVKGGNQWCYAKSFDTFLPLGPRLAKLSVAEVAAMRITTRLNGETVQDAPFSEFLFSIPQVLSHLSAATTLYPGTVVLTGTPGGVGFCRTEPVRAPDGTTTTVKAPRYLRHGDALAVEVASIGTLLCDVAFEA